MIKKNDTVKILSGKDRGKTGKVLSVDPVAGTVLLDGLNVFKKHARPRKQGEKGQIVSLPRPLYLSKVMLFCSSCGKAVRPKIKVSGEKKERACRKCEATI